MFAILFDEFGNLYDAKYVDYATTMEDANRKMKALVRRDCVDHCSSSPTFNEDLDNLIDIYIGSNGCKDFMFSPAGEGSCYRIIEIPGALIPKDACDGFLKSIDEAREMYDDDSRYDWDDADDACRQVCWELEGYLS